VTKIIAVSLFATVLSASHSDADEPLTGAALGTATPNIASKYPDLHRTLTDGTYDSMPFEQQIMFLHEPFFRDLAEFGLDTVAIDAEREFIADMASNLADAAEASASVYQIDDVFKQQVLELHTAVFVAHDRATELADPAVSAQEFIRERRQVMALQRRMLDIHLQTMEMAQEAWTRFDGASPNEALPPADEETHIQERFNHHRKSTAQTPAQMARRVVRGQVLGGMSSFAPEDQALLRSINDLDTDTIERQALDPIMRQLCALPVDDVRGRARLMNEASQAEQAALDAATTAILDRLTAHGSSRIEALVQSDRRNESSSELDWEGIAIDLPQVAEGIFVGACDQYDLLVGIEEVLDSGGSLTPDR